jgi:transcriptional regulator of NAD metabolism
MHIKNSVSTTDERDELWKIVDEIVHHKIVGKILEALDEKHHVEFLDRFKEYPHDESLITFFNEKTGRDFSEMIKKEINNIEDEIIRFLLKE